MALEQAIKNRKAWKIKDRPTIVLLYDPSKKDHMKSLSKVSKDRSFVSASHYFNLLRIDVRTINDRKVRKGIGKDAMYVLFQANGDRVAAVKKPMSGKPFTKHFDKIMLSDFGKSRQKCIASMGAVLAREAWVEDEIKRHETVLIDPLSGKVQENIKKAIADYRKELKDLKLHQDILVRLRQGALTASR